MPWFWVDDGFAFHRKTVQAGNAAVGLWVRAGSWCARELTDGFVPTHMAHMMGTPAQARKLVQSGLWVADDERGGYQFHEWTGYNRSRDQVLAERAYNARKASLQRDKELVAAVRKRDGDRCRYCGCLVNWTDRRGTAGATYDHVDPDGPNSLENVVVACRSCNSRKGARSVTLSGMRLLPAKAMGISEGTAGQDSAYQVRSGSGPDQTQVGTGTDQGPFPSLPQPFPTSPKGDVTTTSRADAPSDFDRFWAAYPRRTGKGAAEKAWAKAAAKGADPQRLIDAATHFAAARQDQDPRFTPHPATWLNQRRWEDEDQPPLRLVSGGYEPYQNPTDLNAYHEGLL